MSSTCDGNALIKAAGIAMLVAGLAWAARARKGDKVEAKVGRAQGKEETTKGGRQRERGKEAVSQVKESTCNLREELLQQQVARKKAFLDEPRNQERYGYVHSPAGFIDFWRAVELPRLVRPIHVDRGRRANEEGNCYDDGSHNDDDAVVYLDYAGASLPVRQQLLAIVDDALENPLGNPHSTGPIAAASSRAYERAKLRVLEHFCGKDSQHDYDLIFTSGASASFKLVAEYFPWEKEGQADGQQCFVYSHNAHTSLAGMRNVAARKSAISRCDNLSFLEAAAHKVISRKAAEVYSINGDRASFVAPYGFDELQGKNASASDIHNERGKLQKQDSSGKAFSLACFPLECNFSGRVSDMRSLARAFHSGAMDSELELEAHRQWIVMADIAKAAATGPVHLPSLDVDLACVSFYKIFGEPTGLGALVGKREVIAALLAQRETSMRDIDLKKPATAKGSPALSYFGGGTVAAWLPSQGFNRCHTWPGAAFADGTAHFRGTSALLHGFDELNRLGGLVAVQNHCSSLQEEACKRLASLRHANGSPAAVIYSHADSCSILTFNMLRANGECVGYAEVNKLAALHRPPIQMRTGCFCNIGACQEAIGLSDADIRHNLELGHRCGDEMDLVDGQPTGAIRVSFGKDSLWEDLDTLLVFLQDTFCSKTERAVKKSNVVVAESSPTLEEIYVYPIKSCAGICVGREGWPLDTQRGLLLFDREWAIVDQAGTVLRLSNHPRLALIKPRIDWQSRSLTLSLSQEFKQSNSLEDLVLYLDEATNKVGGIVSVCGDQCPATSFGGVKSSEWLSAVLGMGCFLVRFLEVQDQARPGHLPAAGEPSADLDLSRRIPESQLRARAVKQVYFANEAPLLAISQDSVATLNKVLAQRGDPQVDARSFRANLVISQGSDPLGSICVASDDIGTASGDSSWTRLAVSVSTRKHSPPDGAVSGSAWTTRCVFKITGPCSRCSMVDVDPTSGAKNGSTLRALAAYSRQKSRILFGVFCSFESVTYDQFTSGSQEEPDLVWLYPNQPVSIDRS